MRYRPLIAAASLLALPVSAFAAGPKSLDQSSDYYTKKICKVNTPTGSRLGGVKRCRTKHEEAQLRLDTRQVIEKVQIGGNARCSFAGQSGAQQSAAGGCAQ